jgi:hypothetical protein
VDGIPSLVGFEPVTLRPRHLRLAAEEPRCSGDRSRSEGGAGETALILRTTRDASSRSVSRAASILESATAVSVDSDATGQMVRRDVRARFFDGPSEQRDV